jgi:hypothetical protein
MTRCLAVVLALVLPVGSLWSAAPAEERLKPVNLKGLNTANDEDDPHLSWSALQMYYTSTTSGKSDVWVSKRLRAGLPWPAGQQVPDLEGQADYRSVFLTPESTFPQYFYFASDKDPETGNRGNNYDIYFLIKQGPRADFTSEQAVLAVDTESDEADPWLTADGRSLYFSRKDKDGWHEHVATRPRAGGQLSAPVQLKLPVGFHHATLTYDGRTMYLQGPLDKQRWGLFRSSLAASGWSDPEPLTELNDPDAPTGDRSPCLSRDGSLLYFASDRAGGQGGLDIWVVPTADLKKK